MLLRGSISSSCSMTIFICCGPRSSGVNEALKTICSFPSDPKFLMGIDWIIGTLLPIFRLTVAIRGSSIFRPVTARLNVNLILFEGLTANLSLVVTVDDVISKGGETVRPETQI